MNSSDGWVKAQTVATVVGLAAVVLASIAVVVDRVRNVQKRDDGSTAADSKKMMYFFVDRVGWWSTFWGKQTEPLCVTRITGLIEAGDRGLWTSAAFDHMPEGHAQISWVPLYGSIYEEVARKDSEKTIGWLGVGLTAEFLARARRSPDSWSKSHRWGLYENKKLVNCCRELEDKDTENENGGMTAMRGLGRVRQTWTLGKKPCIEITREELVALALVLGISMKIDEYSQSLNGIGAFGLSLYATQNHGTWTLSLAQGSRIPRHMPSPSSGYTTLMAKHLACGSIPFAQSSRWVKSVYITDEVLRAIQEGRNIKDILAFGGPSLELLRWLPAEKEIDAYYGVAESKAASDVGLILKPDGQKTGLWHRAVVGIVFGGLVPQVAKNVSEAVKFTIAGSFGKCIEELEELVNELHNLDVESDLFGEHVTSRCAARALVDFVNYTVPSEYSNSRDAAAVFARYANLLERISARCRKPRKAPGQNGNVQPSSGLPSIGDPPAGQLHGEQETDHVFNAACDLIGKVYVARVQDPDRLSLEEKQLVDRDLGSELVGVRERLSENTPISVDDCATVVRCVLAAWAYQVPNIELNEYIDENNIPGRNRLTSLYDLPPVSALG